MRLFSSKSRGKFYCLDYDKREMEDMLNDVRKNFAELKEEWAKLHAENDASSDWVIR